MESLINKLHSRWVTPLALLVIAFFSYGVFAFQQGFHWDDWGFVWLIRTLGRQGFSDYFATSRPFLTYIYSITTQLLGTNPWGWQLFSLFWRWLSAVSLWLMLKKIWPERKSATYLVSVLFLIYPGFNQQAVAITYSHFFLAQTALFTSIILMIWFADKPLKYWWACILALALSAINLFSIEYFFGMELLRPFFLWIYLQNSETDWKTILKRASLIYVPFLLVVLWFLFWRYTFESGYQLELVSDISTSPVNQLQSIPATILEQIKVAGWLAWQQIFQLPDFEKYGPRLTFIYFIGLVITGTILYATMQKSQNSTKRDWQISIQWIALGLFSMLLAGIPFLVANFPLRLTFPNSRFTLPFALGASFLFVAILELLHQWKHKVLLASILATLATGVQFNNSYLWREDWKSQKSFFWQLNWRIPDLEPGTILLSSDTPFDYSSDNSLTFPLNMIYAPNNNSTKISYAYLFVSVRLGNEIESLKPGLPVHQDYWAATFDSTSDQVVAVHFAPPGCFRVLHPVYDRDLPLAPGTGEVADHWLETGVPILPRTAAKALTLSNLEQIIPTSSNNVSLPSVFGPEPTQTWCYYFEKADLARQADDWTSVAEIGDEVFAIPYHPDDLSEYLPFIEAYGRTGNWDEARDLTLKTADAMPILKPALCALWQRVESDSETQIMTTQIEELKAELGYCPYP
jgi:hypothetical protein